MNKEQTITGVIRGTGACVPKRVLDNNEIAGFVDTSDEWIRERTGIKRRHIVEAETTVSMAVEAGRQALEEAGVSPEEVDMILVATSSADQVFPGTACEVQKRLGATGAVGFDLNAACSGFLFAYNTAQTYISSGIYESVLVIGSESISRLIDWTDRGTCILFGDGAGAVLLQAEEGRRYRSVMHSDGTGSAALTGPGVVNRVRSIDRDCGETKNEYISMNGKDVFQFAVRRVPQVIQEVLKENELSLDEIDWFVLHQANARIVDAVTRRLHLDIDKFPMNLQEYGNTSSASIPILIHELNRKGVLNKGQKLILAGFGAGLSWGASVLIWDTKKSK